MQITRIAAQNNQNLMRTNNSQELQNQNPQTLTKKSDVSFGMISFNRMIKYIKRPYERSAIVSNELLRKMAANEYLKFELWENGNIPRSVHDIDYSLLYSTVHKCDPKSMNGKINAIPFARIDDYINTITEFLNNFKKPEIPAEVKSIRDKFIKTNFEIYNAEEELYNYQTKIDFDHAHENALKEKIETLNLKLKCYEDSEALIREQIARRDRAIATIDKAKATLANLTTQKDATIKKIQSDNLNNRELVD